METPGTLQANSQGTARRLLQAFNAIDPTSKLAIVCVFFGWFLTSTVVVTLGSLQHQVKFYELASVLSDPSRLFFGADSTLRHFVFGAVCLAALCGPVWPHIDRRRIARCGYLAPLGLMLLIGISLYVKTSGDMFASPAPQDSVAHKVIRFANDVARHGGDLVAKHVGLGAGAYLALIGGVVLCVQGMRSTAARGPRSLRQE